MSRFRGLTRLASLVFTLGLVWSLLIALPEKTLARATITTGDLVYEQDSSIYLRHGVNGDTNQVGEGYNLQPDVSPDGSRIAFISQRVPLNDYAVYVMNSDGSGLNRVIPIPGENEPVGFNQHPQWSPDGRWIAFFQQIWSDGPLCGENSPCSLRQILKVPATGGTPVAVVENNAAQEPPTWSPNSERLAYVRIEDSYRSQIWVVDADGSNDHRITSSLGDYSDHNPDWAPDGSRIYVSSTESGGGGDTTGLVYFSSGNEFTSSSVTRSVLTQESDYYYDSYPRVSADGIWVYFVSNGYSSSAYGDLFRVSSSGGTPANLTTTSTITESYPSPVSATYPPAPPSNTTVALSGPSPSDAPYTRQITIGLSATGVQRFEYGRSTSATTAPNTSYLQTSTNLTNKKGTLNFLGAYSGSGTTWNGGTQPNQDWYLWVRSVQTSGTPNAWGTPVKVHAPKQPVWAAAGDSYSSGHHQDTDEPSCANQAPWPFTCEPSDLTPNDASFSWVTAAAAKYNADLHVPTAWQIQPIIVAASGAPTSSFGNGTYAGNPSAWASTGQAGRLSVELYSRYTSWNVSSMTGGANDGNWADVMTTWYIDHFGSSLAPWAIPTGQPIYCPNTESVWDSLHTNDLSDTITANLQGIVAVATHASPGVRVLNVGYPYVVDTGTQSTGNPCYSDWVINGDTYHGVKSVIDTLNTAHTAVTGTNVKNIDIKTAFGATASVSNGYIQLSRLYGYPHPSGGPNGGQSKIADTAISVLTGSGW